MTMGIRNSRWVLLIILLFSVLSSCAFFTGAHDEDKGNVIPLNKISPGPVFGMFALELVLS